jgi:hypothetical protein
MQSFDEAAIGGVGVCALEAETDDIERRWRG